MKTSRRYACNRLYVGDRCFPQSIVEVNNAGEVEGYTPLTQETPATEWIGGVIVLSGQSELPLHENTESLLRTLTDGGRHDYAWHITNFNFQQEALTTASVIRRL